MTNNFKICCNPERMVNMSEHKKVRKILSGLLSVAMMSIPLANFPVSADENTAITYVYDNYTVVYDVTNSWGNTEIVSMTITNTSSSTIEDWMLYFTPNGNIQYVNNAIQVTDSDNGVTYFKNAGYNADISVGDSVTFSYAIDNCSAVPTDYEFVQSRENVPTNDYSVSLNVNETWGTNFNGEIVITNLTDEPIEAWELVVDTNFTITAITNSWAATVTELEPYSYKLKGTYTSYIPANSSVSLGFTGIMDGTPQISDYSMTAIYADLNAFDIVLQCNKKKISTEATDTTVYFYAETDLEVSELQLVDSATNQVVATMYDDGKYSLHGDDMPYDGVYSCKMSIDNSESTYLSYYAKCTITNSISNYTGIKVYVPLTTTDFNEMSAVDTAISNLYSQTEYNSMTTEQKQTTVLQLLKTLATSGTATYPYSLMYENSIIFNGNNLYTFTYKCGVLGTARIEDFNDTENRVEKRNNETNTIDLQSEELDNESNDVNLQINTAKTNGITLDTDGLLGSIYIMYAFDDTTSWRYPYYTQMEERWSEAGLDVTLDTEVTVDDFKHLDSVDIAVFSMHGDYYSTDNPVLVTYESFSSEKDALYAEDLACGNITKAYEHYALFPSFFTDNYTSEGLNDTIIFSESCCFYGEDDDVCYSMSEALIDSGASTVIGFHNSVLASYSRNIMKKVVDELIAGSTTGEALDIAKSIYGDDDNNSSAISPAYPMIDGNTSKMLHSDGISNGGFDEASTPIYWKNEGDTRAIKRLGTFRPTSGSRMGYISTGIGSKEIDYMNATEGSVISQTFKVPENATTLSFKYNIISEEPLEWLGTQYDDTFKALLYNTNGTEVTELAYESIKNSSPDRWTLVPDLDFEGGDDTTYTLGWQTVSYDVSDYAGTYVTLRFCIYDAGDSIYDSIALIDEVKVA